MKEEECGNLYNELRKQITKVNLISNLMVTGNLNARVGNILIPNVIATEGKKGALIIMGADCAVS